MRAGCPSRFRTIIFSSAFAALACGYTLFGVSAGIAAENTAASAFKDPYNGGIKLPKGGGEPGKAYKAYMNAIHRKDKRQLCILMGAKPAEMKECVGQKTLDAYIALYSQTKSEKVLGGFMKGDEATLNVVFTPHAGPPGNGFVVMKKADNRWMISSMGGSGSATINASASGTVDLADGSRTASASAALAAEAEYTGPVYGKWTFTGDDDQGDTWMGTIDIGKLDPDGYDAKKYHFHVVLEMNSSKSEERGIDAPCAWDPDKREMACITEIGEYRAVLSSDRKSLALGAWNALEPEDWSTKKFKVIKSGGWSAVYAGQAAPGTAPAFGGAGVDPEFAVIQISPNIEEYTGKCPVSITYTADITFKMPLPDKFSYRWERSDGKKSKDRVVKPPRNGHLSIREVWRGGKTGEKHDISMRFVAESGGAQMVLDPPGAKVVCK